MQLKLGLTEPPVVCHDLSLIHDYAKDGGPGAV